MLAKGKRNLRWIVDEGVDEDQFCPLDKLNQQDRNLSYKLFCFTLPGYHNGPPYWIWIIGLISLFSEKQGKYFPLKKKKDLFIVVLEFPMTEESKWIWVAWDVHTQINLPLELSLSLDGFTSLCLNFITQFLWFCFFHQVLVNAAEVLPASSHCD